MKQAITFSGMTAAAGEKVQGMVPIGNSGLTMPQTIINGTREGKTILLSSGIHGGEYPGIQTAIELAQELGPDDIHGQLIILHPVNTGAFYQRIQYINPVVGENLNRFYPGNKNGTPAEQIAYFFTEEYHKRVDFMMDLHGGDLHEELPPYVYYPGMASESVVEISRQAALLLNAKYMVKSSAVSGAYNSCAANGTPALLIERGCLGLWSREDVDAYKKDIRNLFVYLGLIEGEVVQPEKPAYLVTQAAYIDSGHDGCWYPAVTTDERVTKGQLLGTVKDFFGNTLEEVHAEYDAIILYMTRSLAVDKGSPIITYGI